MATPYFGSDAKLWYVEEVIPGTTPATPAFLPIRFTADSLILNKETLLSAEITGTRDTGDVRTGANEVTGSISGELSAGTFDDFIEAALQGTWTADVLKVGSEKRSFTIMRETLDSDGVQHFDLFTGCEIASMTFNCAVNSIVTVEFPVIGRGADYDATEPAGATYGTKTATNPMIFVDGDLDVGGGAQALVTSVQQSTDNGASGQRAIGSENLAYIGFGNANNTMTIDGAYCDTAIVDNFATEADVAVTMTFTLSGDSYTVLYPKCRFTSGAPTVTDATALTYSANVQAQRDATEESSIKITRAIT